MISLHKKVRAMRRSPVVRVRQVGVSVRRGLYVIRSRNMGLFLNWLSLSRFLAWRRICIGVCCCRVCLCLRRFSRLFLISFIVPKRIDPTYRLRGSRFRAGPCLSRACWLLLFRGHLSVAYVAVQHSEVVAAITSLSRSKISLGPKVEPRESSDLNYK